MYGIIRLNHSEWTKKKLGRIWDSLNIHGTPHQAIVRRELSDNFCWYNEHYDSLKAGYAMGLERGQWAYAFAPKDGEAEGQGRAWGSGGSANRTLWLKGTRAVVG